MPTKSQILNFVSGLENESVGVLTHQIYAGTESSTRRHNLTQYLALMSQIRPSVILVGEAPGYNGGLFTGLPFTDEQTLLNSAFHLKQSWQYMAHDGPIKKEMASAILWSVLSETANVPLIWNMFPFHPYKIGNELSNRTPRKSELNSGLSFCIQLIEMFQIQQIICIGRKSEITLSKAGVPVSYVRHPSNGGSNAFRIQLSSILHKTLHY